MTRQQVGQVLAVVRLLWPHANLGPDAQQITGLWHAFLERQDAGEVENAIREYAVAGHPFPPTVGQVIQLVIDRRHQAPDEDEMRAEFFRLLKRYSHDQPPPHAAYSHPVLAVFFGTNNSQRWKEWCHAREGDGTFYAQQRDAYKALRARAERDGHTAAIGAPRKPSLTRLDPARTLGIGDPA